MDAVNAITQSKNIGKELSIITKDLIQNSEYANTSPQTIPSPTDTFIKSILEKDELTSPLSELINILYNHFIIFNVL